MKKLIIISTLFIIFSCKSEKSEVENKEKIESNFDYLIGEWIRTNDSDGNQTFENWKKLNDSVYLGHGYTMKENDTVWQENVVLSKIENDWYFQVKSPNDSISTDFKLIEKSDSSFVCENQQNEFPKVIKYIRKLNQIHAEISDDTNKVLFEFSLKN